MGTAVRESRLKVPVQGGKAMFYQQDWFADKEAAEYY
jgi:hypothetical protein